MSEKKAQVTFLNYQLLDVFQTNAPILCSENVLRSILSNQYFLEFSSFVTSLQKEFTFEPGFNNPELIEFQQRRIIDLYNECFYMHLSRDRNIMFDALIEELISGDGYNFAYGLKLYLLFEKKLHLKNSRCMFFSTRLHCNLVSKYYMENPKKKFLSDNEETKFIAEPLAKKMARYKIFK